MPCTTARSDCAPIASERQPRQGTSRREWLRAATGQSLLAALDSRLAAGAVSTGIVGLAGTAKPAVAAAKAWPSRPVRLIVPFATGGSTDIVARLIAPGLGAGVHESIVVDNRAGAGGTIGAQQLATSAPDGYTIGMATVSILGTAPNVYKSLRYDAAKDFAPIIKLVDVPGVISVHPSFPAHDYASFIKLLKENPGRFSYASAGPGSIGHMAMELFNMTAGVKAQHIGYRGAGPALNDVLGGQVPIFWDNLSSSLPYLQSGKLIGIGLAFDRRIEQLPDLPTFAQLGLNDYDATTWFGLIAPAKVPADIVERINKTANEVLKDPALAAKLVEVGAYPGGGTPEAFGTAIDKELKKWADVAKFANVVL